MIKIEKQYAGLGYLGAEERFLLLVTESEQFAKNQEELNENRWKLFTYFIKRYGDEDVLDLLGQFFPVTHKIVTQMLKVRDH